VPSKLRHTTFAWEPSASISTESGASDFTMSAISRAGIRAVPSSRMSTGTRTSVVTSRSVVVRASSPPVVVMSTPVSAGMPGRVETPR
jgi:hypothetical protein